MTVRLVLKKGEMIGDYQVCTRGLEIFFPKTSRRKERRTRDIREVVLEEQANQRLHNLHDSGEFISQLCAEFNKNSRRDAFLQAGSDEQDARQEVNSEDSCGADGQPKKKFLNMDRIRIVKLNSSRDVTGVRV